MRPSGRECRREAGPQDGADDRDARPRQLSELESERRVIDLVLGHRDDDEVRKEGPIRVQIAGRNRVILVSPDDEDAAVGGDRREAAPLPSSTIRSGPSSSASRVPRATFEMPTAPASPPPQRLQPTVGRPVSAAVSRWSEAA